MIKTHEIISDEEILRVHGNANFGTMSPRDVVNESIFKAALGYHNGSTATAILKGHKLTLKPRSPYDRRLLSKKGFKYIQAMHCDGIFSIDNLKKEDGEE